MSEIKNKKHTLVTGIQRSGTTFAGIILTEKIRAHIKNVTDAKNPVLDRGNQLHDLSRDSIALLSYWKDRIDNNERHEIRNITESISSIYYDDQSWV